MIDNNEIQRLAHMANALRPDWPARSLATFLSKNFADRAYGDVAVALAWIATRTKTETPRLLLEAGAWWKASALDGGGTAQRPPRKDEACATCGRREHDHASRWIGDHPFTPLTQATKHRSSDGITAVREALRGRMTETTTEESSDERDRRELGGLRVPDRQLLPEVSPALVRQVARASGR